jgi:hypothetical protein
VPVGQKDSVAADLKTQLILQRIRPVHIAGDCPDLIFAFVSQDPSRSPSTSPAWISMSMGASCPIALRTRSWFPCESLTISIFIFCVWFLPKMPGRSS